MIEQKKNVGGSFVSHAYMSGGSAEVSDFRGSAKGFTQKGGQVTNRHVTSRSKGVVTEVDTYQYATQVHLPSALLTSRAARLS
jgi:hypothetical protein